MELTTQSLAWTSVRVQPRRRNGSLMTPRPATRIRFGSHHGSDVHHVDGAQPSTRSTHISDPARAVTLNASDWFAVGIAGEVVFTSRFLLQWIYSEYKRRSAIPPAFWFTSIAGAAILLSYAIHLHDPVFIIGQAGGLLIYTRNLQLVHRSSRANASREGER